MINQINTVETLLEAAKAAHENYEAFQARERARVAEAEEEARQLSWNGARDWLQQEYPSEFASGWFVLEPLRNEHATTVNYVPLNIPGCAPMTMKVRRHSKARGEHTWSCDGWLVTRAGIVSRRRSPDAAPSLPMYMSYADYDLDDAISFGSEQEDYLRAVHLARQEALSLPGLEAQAAQLREKELLEAQADYDLRQHRKSQATAPAQPTCTVEERALLDSLRAFVGSDEVLPY